MDRNQTNVAIAALLCTTILLIAIFIWPTPYEYLKVSRPAWRGIGAEHDEVWRINRLTGSAVEVTLPE